MSLELTRHGEAHRADDLRKIGIAKDDTPSKSPGKRLEQANCGIFYVLSLIYVMFDFSFMLHFVKMLCFMSFLIFASRNCGFEQIEVNLYIHLSFWLLMVGVLLYCNMTVAEASNDLRSHARHCICLPLLLVAEVRQHRRLIPLAMAQLLLLADQPLLPAARTC